MEEYPLHIFVVVRVSVSMIMSFVPMVVAVAMMRMTEGYKPYDVNDKTKDTDDQKLIEPLQLVTFPEAFEAIEYDLYTDKPGFS
jgi:hypothetical protein